MKIGARATRPRHAAICVLLAVSLIAGYARASESADGNEFFEKRIRPVLSEQCYKCHSAGAEKLKGGLMADSRESLLKGGDTGAAIVPGDVENSLLIGAVRWSDKDLQMPPKHRLSPEQVADLESWVKSGAPWPAETGAKTAVKKGFDLERRKQEHWCWQPLLKAAVPEVKDGAWPTCAIDRFVLSRLEEKGLKPAGNADRRTLIRRVSFDLIGLPPTPEEVEAFVKDSAPDAFEKVVDRLLASPQFGERWGRHWLDLVRYAETRGHEFDADIPNAWQYRDYVIRALNSDVPYNQFALEHFAGDLMTPRLNPKTGADESILGTGFWFLGEEVHSPVDIRQDEADRMDNRIDVMGKAFLGLTVGCARCHDHKFDAISQRDYYALTGFLISSGYRQARFETLVADREISRQLEKVRGDARTKVLREMAQALRPGIGNSANDLMAAAASLQGKHLPVGSAETPVNSETVERWASELKAAASDPQNPLHLFATVANATKGGQSGTQSLETIKAAPSSQKATAGFAPEQIVVNYAECEVKNWMQDGFSYGSQPLRAGEPVFGNTTGQPLLGIETRGAAVRDLAWKGLDVRCAEHDFGNLGKWDRGEKTLRTPETVVTAGRLWYLVKGAGRAYAVVNSHLLVNGPLHGALLREWNDGGGRWHWVEQNLADYVGHRVHVEFSPAGESDFAVAMVVQAKERPALPDEPNVLVTAASQKIAEPSPEALAAATQRVLVAACDRLGADQIVGKDDAEDWAKLADWLVRKLDLFCPQDSPERRHLAEACQDLITHQAELAGQIRTDSHTAPAMSDGSGADEFVLVRGQSKSPGAQVPRRFLEAIAGPDQPVITSGSGRLELARRVVDPSNPLTARVIVNRIWYHLLGRGIVPTVDNFGVLGEAPSNRELLDYLTARFIREQGWSIKKAIREIVLSRTYQMSSEPSDAHAEQVDPQNALLHRMNLRRLEGEIIRDEILAVSGQINLEMGGPSVPVHLTSFMEGRGRPSHSGPLDGNGRRSIYQEIRRNFLSPMMLAFDMPIPFNAMGRRNLSNVPAQALILMNDPFVIGQAKAWVHRLKPANTGERITQMYELAFCSPPSDAELADGTAFVREQAALYRKPESDETVWADYAHVLFNVKEFIYLN